MGAGEGGSCSRKQERGILLLSSLFPLYLVWDPDSEIVPLTLGTGLLTSINPT